MNRFRRHAADGAVTALTPDALVSRVVAMSAVGRTLQPNGEEPSE